MRLTSAGSRWPDARSGARPPLLPALALLLGVLSMFTPAPVEAQTPAAPTGLTVRPGADALFIDWNAPAQETGAPITAYDVHYTYATSAAVADDAPATKYGGAGEPSIEWVIAPRPSPWTSNSRYMGGLKAGTTYRVRVQAWNKHGPGALSTPVSGIPNMDNYVSPGNPGDTIGTPVTPTEATPENPGSEDGEGDGGSDSSNDEVNVGGEVTLDLGDGGGAPTNNDGDNNNDDNGDDDNNDGSTTTSATNTEPIEAATFVNPSMISESGAGADVSISPVVWLSRAPTSQEGNVMVDYTTADGTATAVQDYRARSGTLTFKPGETEKRVQIRIIDDNVEDSGETFLFRISNPRPSPNARLKQGKTQVTITILNDEGGTSVTSTPPPTPPNNNNGGGNAGSGSAGGGGGGSRSTPAPASRAALSDLVVTPRDEDGRPGKRLALSPAFAPGTTAYTLDVPYSTGALDIMPGLTSGTAAVGTRSDGTTSVFPAAPSYSISLPPGETTVVEIMVTAKDGQRTRRYTLRATRAAPNTDPALPALVVRGNDDADITLSPAFTPDNTDYQASLAYTVDAVTLTPGARVRIGGREVPGGQASAPVPLAVGSNEITLTVTAEDGITTRAYTLTLARAGAHAEAPTADPRALPDLSRALADDTQASIATRLETARTPGRSGSTAPLSARLTQALSAVLPGQAAGAAAPTPAFDPVPAEARVHSGWAAPAAPVNWQALLDNAGASLALGATPDAGESPTGLASLSLWSDGAYRNVGGRHDGLDWHGELLGARLGLDMRLTPSLTGGAALGWQRAGWSGNAGNADDAGATRHTLSLLGLNPYAGWQRGRLSAWISGGLGKGTLNSRYRGEADNGTTPLRTPAAQTAGDGLEVRPQLPGANGHSADGYSPDAYHGDTHSEDVTTHTLGGGLAGRLFDTDALRLGLKAEALATGLATETHATRTHRLRLALDARHVRRLGNDATLTPALELGLRHDGGAGPGGLGLEAGGALHYAGGPLTLRGQARTLIGRDGYREWGLAGTAEWRARSDGRGLTLRLAPGLGQAQSGIGQLWAQGLREQTHGTPSQAAARLDASLSYAWDAPGYRGRITPYLALHRQQASAAYRLGARWDAPGGFSLRLAGERNDGHAGMPADHALLLEGSWRPGR